MRRIKLLENTGISYSYLLSFCQAASGTNVTAGMLHIAVSAINKLAVLQLQALPQSIPMPAIIRSRCDKQTWTIGLRLRNLVYLGLILGSPPPQGLRHCISTFCWNLVTLD